MKYFTAVREFFILITKAPNQQLQLKIQMAGWPLAMQAFMMKTDILKSLIVLKTWDK